MIDFLLSRRKSIKNKQPIVGPENENYWSFGDSYIKGAWALHTLRHVIDNDNLWWNILKSFAVDNVSNHVKTIDFQLHVNSMTDQDFTYFFEQYFFDHRPPELHYNQIGNKLYYRWANVIPDFTMPLDVNINGVEKRIYPTDKIQELKVPEYSVIIFRDWEFLTNLKENSLLDG